MSPYYTDEAVTLWHGDCLDVLATLTDASVDAVVTDPPYGLEFMGKEWDSFRPSGARIRQPSERDMTPGAAHNDTTFLARRNTPEAYVAGKAFGAWCELWAAECLRVLKPGGHLLAFGGTRTWHRLACAVEDAGFEVRDSIAWLYGSGFPKSLNVALAIDKGTDPEWELGAPISDAARQWQGWGTALKPSHEPIVVARKPLTGTVASNVLAYGTGALNIDGCRVGSEPAFVARRGGKSVGGLLNDTDGERITSGGAGRWPANVVLDDAQATELDQQSGITRDGVAVRHRGVKAGMYGPDLAPGSSDLGYGGEGGASRFFPVFRYEAKAPTTERPRGDDGTAHPTVKPLDLIRWLVRLVTPPGGTVLDPFLGSGTTAEACIVEGFRCIGVERDEGYLRLAAARLAKPIAPVLFGEGTA